VNPDALKRLVSLREASKLARVRFDRIKALVAGGHLAAFRDGGSDEKPQPRVDADEIGQAMLNASRYVPRGVTMRLRKPRAARPTGSHPLVDC
jgi:hypothetical protein